MYNYIIYKYTSQRINYKKYYENRTYTLYELLLLLQGSDSVAFIENENAERVINGFFTHQYGEGGIRV